jgi:hypothetical protein
MMGLTGLFHLLPEVAAAETRSVKLAGTADDAGPGVPPGDDYGFIEYYCTDRKCDCQRVLITVLARSTGRTVATISHSFDPPPPGGPVDGQTFLDPLGTQSKFAAGMLELFRDVVLDSPYAARLRRHYRMVKELNRPNHPKLPPPRRRVRPKRG